MKKTIFMVQFLWSTEDDSGEEHYHFWEYGAAYKKFNEIVTAECHPQMSWVGDLALDENGNVNQGYEAEIPAAPEGEEELRFYVADSDNRDIYSLITLERVEVQ